VAAGQPGEQPAASPRPPRGSEDGHRAGQHELHIA